MKDTCHIRRPFYWKWCLQFESVDEVTALERFDNFHAEQQGVIDWKDGSPAIEHPIPLSRAETGHTTSTWSNETSPHASETHRAYTRRVARRVQTLDTDADASDSDDGALDGQLPMPNSDNHPDSICGDSNATHQLQLVDLQLLGMLILRWPRWPSLHPHRTLVSTFRVRRVQQAKV